MMDIPTDVRIVCLDGPFGYLDGIILNPVTDEVTHVVAKEDQLFGVKRLVPVEKIAKSNFRYLLLNCTLNELSEFAPFADLENRTLVSWPYATTKPGFIPTEYEHIPANELMIRRGTEVFAIDGKVGFLDELMVEPDHHKITDLAIRLDYFWGYKDIAVPLDQIENIKENSVNLKLNKAMIESLPVLIHHEK